MGRTRRQNDIEITIFRDVPDYVSCGPPKLAETNNSTPGLFFRSRCPLGAPVVVVVSVPIPYSSRTTRTTVLVYL